MEQVWNKFGKCLGNVWNILCLIINILTYIFGKCLGNVWEMFGKCLEVEGNSAGIGWVVLGTSLWDSGEVWEIQEKRMEGKRVVWNKFGKCLGNVWEMFGTFFD